MSERDKSGNGDSKKEFCFPYPCLGLQRLIFQDFLERTYGPRVIFFQLLGSYGFKYTLLIQSVSSILFTYVSTKAKNWAILRLADHFGTDQRSQPKSENKIILTLNRTLDNQFTKWLAKSN